MTEQVQREGSTSPKMKYKAMNRIESHLNPYYSQKALVVDNPMAATLLRLQKQRDELKQRKTSEVDIFRSTLNTS